MEYLSHNTRSEGTKWDRIGDESTEISSSMHDTKCGRGVESTSVIDLEGFMLESKRILQTA